MKFLLLLWVAILASVSAFSQVITSSIYSATELPVVNQPGYEERTLFEGTSRDFSHVILQTITIPARQPDQPTQELDEEAIFIVKAGELTLTLGSKQKVLGPGSVVLIMPGDEYRIDNKAAQSLTYYEVRYTSNEVPDLDLYRLMGSSFWVDWQEITPTIDQQGTSRRTVRHSTVMSNRMVMDVTTRSPGSGSFQPHTHRAAELVFVLKQPIQVQIGGVLNEAKPGDVIFLESELAHSIQNGSQEGVTYLSIQL